MPVSKFFCKIPNNKIVGIEAMIHAKNIAGALALPIMEMLAMIGRISGDFVNVKPNIKSFYDHVNCERKTIDNGALAIGTKICVKICHVFAPSILADSQTSPEIPIKKFLSTNIQNGIQIAV